MKVWECSMQKQYFGKMDRKVWRSDRIGLTIAEGLSNGKRSRQKKLFLVTVATDGKSIRISMERTNARIA